MNPTTHVSIIIPCFERAEELQKLLFSLKKINFSGFREIIIVDDGSKNHQAIKKAADDFKCSLIPLAKNVGPSEARNIGAKKANGEFLWFLDSDTEINDPHLLATLIKCFEQNESLAGVGGETIEIDGGIYSVNDHYLPNRIPLRKYLPINKPFEIHPEFIATNNLLVLKKDFLSVNGFSSFFDLYEDQDFCLRLAHLGKTFLVRNDTCVTHHHSPGGREGSKFWFFDKVRNYLLKMHLGRTKIIFLHFPYRLPLLPLLDIIFIPIALFYRIFYPQQMHYSNLILKTKNPFRNFLMFVFFNLMAMFSAWFMAWTFIVKSVTIGKKATISKK